MEYAHSRGVYRMVAERSSQPILEIFEILRVGRYRQMMEMLLITGLDERQVGELFVEGVHCPIAEETVSLYRHYFWDTDIMTKRDWKEFLFGKGGYYNAGDLWSFLIIPTHLALWKMGFTKRISVDRVEALSDIFNTAYIKSVESSIEGDVDYFRKSAMVAISAYEASRTTSIDAESVIDLLRGIKLGTVNAGVVTLKEFTKGQHSQGSVLQLPSKAEAHNARPQ
jgi:hypothetical protein